MIKLSKENKVKITQEIQEWFRENLDQEIGNLDAEFLLDFFAEKIGGFFYNEALSDVHSLINERTETLIDEIYILTKPIL
ncbi:MAG TPA: DUF2164 domain-containing protein [Candidatus Marinimicrobia bacterium]|jgi:uncharacterized protein (DUF2164 family)|nr:hypothetical protein [Candidatus Neomarinimicrobiota bacterium]MDP6296567.1 DUF2164 domain-containing protein [Candidatus Neomarinimicrobiota bacterium]MDP7122184.1 DUF2164 domain-containing protein [Candidatus Neomarinimicrobiota bacterium]MDP7484037.1 DUF2164 domain-containing protein [Candidatus Neomarinimicrobiota bacterium]MDP7716354.1 DUF2164 domain-containing protein [Candidatus Neomarinimicrobiota bacterium]|tara:strand:- start:8894 stop:9133 length:240 start_codon:yes stop_codon:yes gene_type:complete